MQVLVLPSNNVGEDQYGNDYGDNGEDGKVGQDGDDENKGDGEKINL